ncbi:hypothetical protein PTNB73_01567 [Pyrenophora teres f. teres]|nr:hypothetical protein HRS9122_01113 [Pyrenophora teres f. teres]KAE8872416.1 hypothetical protein PTNB73_01567 [Pyrenophora teres f. teres]
MKLSTTIMFYLAASAMGQARCRRYKSCTDGKCVSGTHDVCEVLNQFNGGDFCVKSNGFCKRGSCFDCKGDGNGVVVCRYCEGISVASLKWLLGILVDLSQIVMTVGGLVLNWGSSLSLSVISVVDQNHHSLFVGIRFHQPSYAESHISYESTESTLGGIQQTMHVACI